MLFKNICWKIASEKVSKNKLRLKHANQMSRQKDELLRWSEKCVGAVDKVSGSNDIQPKEEKKIIPIVLSQASFVASSVMSLWA